MENKRLLEKISEMRKNFVADRVRDKQDQAYVEEKGRALLSLRRSGNQVVRRQGETQENPGGGSCDNEVPEKPLLGA